LHVVPQLLTKCKFASECSWVDKVFGYFEL